METKFNVDQRVVYPSQGVGIVTEIFKKTFKDQELDYYKIHIEASDMTVMVPVQKAEELGIRQIVQPTEAQEALDFLGAPLDEPITSDWKQRYQNNLDLLKNGTVKDIAKIVRCLYHRSKVKELPILERKLYDNAKKLFEDEIAFSLDKTEKEVEALIHAKLEPNGPIQKTKHSAHDDEYAEDEEDLMGDVNQNNDADDSDGEEEDLF